MKTLISISRGTWKYPFTAEGPDEDNHFKVQQRDLMKTSFQSSAEGPDEDIHSKFSRGT
jgi:hypothetical protein